MALGDRSPLSVSNLPGKRLHDNNGGSRGLSTNSKRPKKFPPAPEFSKYSDVIPGFHETGFLKVRSERTSDLAVNPLRMLKLTNGEERLRNSSGKDDLVNDPENGTFCKQNAISVSPNNSPRSPIVVSKVRPTKIQICDPVPRSRFTKTKVSKVRIARTSDEDDCASEKVSERVPLKELAKPHSLDAKSAKGGNFVPAKESCNPSTFRDGEEAIIRSKVIETMGLFDKEYEEALKAKLKGQGTAWEHISRIATRVVKDKMNWVKSDHIGVVHGIEIGDQFQFKGQLDLIGLHHQYNNGISYIKQGEKCYATSIVDSGRYTSKTAADPNTIFFSGQGGNPLFCQQNRVDDQKLERGNLALKNSMEAKIPIRVIRKLQILRESKKEKVFVYDGLYTVSKCTQERGQFDKLIYMFELKRKSGQPRLENCIMSKPRKPKERNGVFLVDDISQGKEKIPIRAFNALDREKPPCFKYITEMVYPKSSKFSSTMPSTSFGCNCVSGCLDSDKNGGKFLFNENGALVNTKPTVYLCGPSCRNRISQSDFKYQLEIFKTEYKSWGVRSRNFISEGSFICEYVGMLSRSMEANKGTRHKKYVLYAIGNEAEKSRYKKDTSHDTRYDIDATECGNVARFINHSNSPNLYAQIVVYEHDGKKMPRVMLFALKNITPCRELTLSYNYKD